MQEPYRDVPKLKAKKTLKSQASLAPEEYLRWVCYFRSSDRVRFDVHWYPCQTDFAPDVNITRVWYPCQTDLAPEVNVTKVSFPCHTDLAREKCVFLIFFSLS